MREYTFADFAFAAATVSARLRDAMVKKSGAAAIILRKDRRSFRPLGVSGSGNIVLSFLA
jgi:hypothetical protein